MLILELFHITQISIVSDWVENVFCCDEVSEVESVLTLFYV